MDGNSTGTYNTAIGADTLKNNLSGSGNTVIGHGADVGSSDLKHATAIGADARVDTSDTIQLGNQFLLAVNTSGKLTTGEVTYPNVAGGIGTVLGYNANGQLDWINGNQIAGVHRQELEEQIAALQDQLQSQQAELESQKEELFAIVQSQQEQVAQLQRMVEHQFATN